MTQRRDDRPIDSIDDPLGSNELQAQYGNTH